MPPDDRSRRQHPAAPAPSPVEEEGTHSLADGGNSVADPRAVGDLLQTWLGIQLDTVDDLVAEARDKVDAIPSWKTIAQLVGELVISQHALEAEVAGLRAELDRLHRGHRGRRVA